MKNIFYKYWHYIKHGLRINWKDRLSNSSDDSGVDSWKKDSLRHKNFQISQKSNHLQMEILEIVYGITINQSITLDIEDVF